MTRHNEQIPELFGEQQDPNLARAFADLERAYTATPPPHLRASMDRSIYAGIEAGRNRTSNRRLRFPRWQLQPSRARLSLTSLGVALLLALGGMVGVLRANGPTPVSAQTVLRRAAAFQPASSQASHLTYRVTMTYGGAGTADVWIENSAAGEPSRSAQTLALTVGAKGPMSSRYIQIGQQVYAYNPEFRGDNTIAFPEARSTPSWLQPSDVFDGATIAQQLGAIEQSLPGSVHLLPERSLDGHTVNPVEVDGGADAPGRRTILYFDAQSALLRGFDAINTDPSYAAPSWQARLSSYQTVPAAAVPPHTFTLNAPDTARVLPPTPVKSDLLAAFASACHTTADLKDALRSGERLLAACQATAPAITQEALVARLAAPIKSQLEAAVAAGQITPAQEADGLASLNRQLSDLVAGGGMTQK